MSKRIDSARSHLLAIHSTGNKSPLHLAVIDLFDHAAVAEGGKPLPTDEEMKEAARLRNRGESGDESESESDGLRPAPRPVKRSGRK